MSTSFKCKVSDIYEIDYVNNNNDDNDDENDDENDDDEMRCSAHCAKANWVRSQLLETLMRSNCGENINCLVKDNDDESDDFYLMIFSFSLTFFEWCMIQFYSCIFSASCVKIRN